MSSLAPSNSLKVMIIVGARPNFMKAAPIARAIRAHNEMNAAVEIRQLLVHTGQHYDQAMSDRFFADLGLPRPEVHLGVGSGSHAVQTANIMTKFEEVLLKEKPHAIIVVGDVNSTLACGLVAAKIAFDSSGSRPVIAHVEAGLRSRDRMMPEEVNRVATDHLSDLLFVTEESGVKNLRAEGIPEERIHFVGNTMIDSLLAFQNEFDSSTIADDLGLRAGPSAEGRQGAVTDYALLTLHRPSNVDNVETFREIILGVGELASRYPIIFPVHPRTQQRIKDFGLDHYFGARRFLEGGGAASGSGIILTKPLGYLDFMCLMKGARIVITDSGGIQEETTCLRVPCVTVRENTERPVTVENGTNLIAGTKQIGIQSAIRQQLAKTFEGVPPKNWDGRAGQRIVSVIVRECCYRNTVDESLLVERTQI